MKLHDTPSTENLPTYRTPPISGNQINGLGIKEKNRPKRVFHALWRTDFPWAGMNAFFIMNNPWELLWEALKYRWNMRRSTGPVARQRVEVNAPNEMAQQLKEKAKEFGTGIVGITEIMPEDLYDDVELNYRYAICIGVPMRREEMLHVPHARAGQEVQRCYGEVGGVAIELAEYIRSIGWPAYAYGDPRSTDILQIPLAIRAGLGQLGKHGSIICKEYGSNVRLSTVATNIPLALDKPIDIGVDDLCIGCRRCTMDCPPNAITDKKQWVRGEYRWYVDFDKCVPYFTATYGCAICIEVCPWSEPDRGTKLSQMLLVKRNKNGSSPDRVGSLTYRV
ncbi:MAG: 4Fe-4S dicluster domain-containing protein [Proteobacteria bacterium]|nr:4Fe-4S dicluster domain-containing protein [Pseudomonadota bacterium]